MDARSLWKFLFGRRRSRAPASRWEEWRTWANAITLARAVITTVILALAISRGSHSLLLVGLAVSMVLDFVDGQIARLGKMESVPGALFDGLADRLATTLVAAGMISLHNEPFVIAAAVCVWVQFVALDHYFAWQFLRFGELASPDHFHLLRAPHGEQVWRMNWSAAAKLASNLPIVLLAVGAWWAAIALSIALLAVRIPGYTHVAALVRERQLEIEQAHAALEREEERLAEEATRARGLEEALEVGAFH